MAAKLPAPATGAKPAPLDEPDLAADEPPVADEAPDLAAEAAEETPDLAAEATDEAPDLAPEAAEVAPEQQLRRLKLIKWWRISFLTVIDCCSS